MKKYESTVFIVIVRQENYECCNRCKLNTLSFSSFNTIVFFSFDDSFSNKNASKIFEALLEWFRTSTFNDWISLERKKSCGSVQNVYGHVFMVGVLNFFSSSDINFVFIDEISKT